MSKKQVSDLLNRAFHTFWQAAATYLLLNLGNISEAFQASGFSGVKAAGMALVAGAVGAGLSALKTFVKETA